jgi:hypothetical protein
MSAVYVSNIVINSGADFIQSFTFDSNTTNSVLDLSNHSVESQIRKHSGSSNYVSFASSITVPSRGVVELSLTADQTTSLKPGRYLYDIILTDNVSGKKSRVLEGMVLVREGVTK